MLRRLLSIYLLGRLFRIFSGRHHLVHPVRHRSQAHRPWGRRGHYADLAGLIGFQRRRRSFI